MGWRSFVRGPAAGPLETMFNAASLSFPPNERFFIDSVRAYADRITDPVLKAEVRGFVYQEAMHNKVHAGFNLAIFLKLLAIVTFWHSNLRRPFWRALIDVARHNPAALEVTILQMGSSCTLANMLRAWSGIWTSGSGHCPVHRLDKPRLVMRKGLSAANWRRRATCQFSRERFSGFLW